MWHNHFTLFGVQAVLVSGAILLAFSYGRGGCERVPIADTKALVLDGSVLSELSRQAICDIQHLYRPAHLQMLANILEVPVRMEICGYSEKSFRPFGAL